MRDTLQRAIFSGSLRVQFADQLVEYTSVDDRRKALADIDAAIATAYRGHWCLLSSHGEPRSAVPVFSLPHSW
jgi:hypothetical protein